jgi:hypothetical protein
VGFFHASGFGTPGDIEDALGFAVNGWINTLHIVVGAIGLFAAGYAARAYSLGAAILFGALAIWGFAAGSDDALLDRFPADEAENLLHALLAVLGLAAFLAERPARERKPAESAEERRERDERRRAEKKKRAEQKRDEKQRREERKKRDEKRRAAKSAASDRSQQSEDDDAPASRDDEPRKGRGRPSQRRRRPPRPPA